MGGKLGSLAGRQMALFAQVRGRNYDEVAAQVLAQVRTFPPCPVSRGASLAGVAGRSLCGTLQRRQLLCTTNAGAGWSPLHMVAPCMGHAARCACPDDTACHAGMHTVAGPMLGTRNAACVQVPTQFEQFFQKRGLPKTFSNDSALATEMRRRSREL